LPAGGAGDRPLIAFVRRMRVILRIHPRSTAEREKTGSHRLGPSSASELWRRPMTTPPLIPRIGMMPRCER
jgi:hypothetical protein